MKTHAKFENKTVLSLVLELSVSELEALESLLKRNVSVPQVFSEDPGSLSDRVKQVMDSLMAAIREANVEGFDD